MARHSFAMLSAAARSIRAVGPATHRRLGQRARFWRSGWMVTGPVLALSLYYLGILVYHGALCALYPFDLNYQEGFSLNDAVRLVTGQPVWGDITQFPMVRSPYPPLYLLVYGLLTVGEPSLLPGRLISLVATLVIGALLVWRVRHLGVLVAAATGGMWVGSTFVYQWAPLARVDLLGLALSLAGVLVLEPRITIRRLLLAALLCGAGLLTKQTLIAAPLAIAFYLLWKRDRRILIFAGLLTLVVGGAGLWLTISSDGQFLRHVVFGNAANRFRLDRMVELSYLFFSLNGVLVGLALVGGLAVWRRHGLTLVGVYAPLATLTVFTIGNVSGDINYFLEPTVALALLLPFAMQGGYGAAPKGPRLELRRLPFAMLVLVQLVLLVHVPNGFRSQHPPGPAKGKTPIAEDYVVGAQVLDLVRTAGPRALVEPAGFAAQLGYPVWIQPIDLVAEQRLGRWSPDLLVGTIEAQQWTVIVLNYKFLPTEVLAAIERSYMQTDGLASPNGFSYFIYHPRPPKM